MQGTRALLGLVIVMGLMILAGTATLIGVVVHRLARAGSNAIAPVGLPAESQTAAPLLTGEPPGTRIVSVARQSDTLLSILLSGGGPDRIVIWDLSVGRERAEIRLAP